MRVAWLVAGVRGRRRRARARRCGRGGCAGVDAPIMSALNYLNERSISTMAAAPPLPVAFETRPDRYQHWKLAVDGPVATLSMDVREDGGLSSDYRLKLNSYDLA